MYKYYLLGGFILVTHRIWKFIYSCNLVPLSNNHSKKFAWTHQMDHVLGVFSIHIDDEILNFIDDFVCPHDLWIATWEIYEDPNVQPFTYDLILDCNVPLHFL